MSRKTRVGVIGFGHLGQYLCNKIVEDDNLDLVAVWNRNTCVPNSPFPIRALDELSKSPLPQLDIVVEVAHPDVTREYLETILANCNYLIGSPTALAQSEMLTRTIELAEKYGKCVFVPAGAMWGAEDIKKMADLDTLADLHVTMKKHPSCLMLVGQLRESLAKVTDKATILYEGPVRPLCSLAPNNVNTMAAACVAAHTLGFDKVRATLIADPTLADAHIVDVLAVGKGGLKVHTVRTNPANVGAVTGSATYASFYASLKRAAFERPPGVHLC